MEIDILLANKTILDSGDIFIFHYHIDYIYDKFFQRYLIYQLFFQTLLNYT